MTLDDWQREGRVFSYRGRRVFYRREGSGEALVLIHGFPTASWDWHLLWDELTQGFDVIASDMIGFGFSDKPPAYDYSIMDQATLHETLLAELGVETAHILAHDYGTSVAQELLARHAETTTRGGPGLHIRSVCLLNGGIIPGTHRPLLIQKLLMSPAGGLLARLVSERSLRRSFRRIFGASTQPSDEEIRQFWTLIETGDGRRVVPKIIRYMAERETHQDRWVGILKETSVPLRLINGLADPISGAHVVEAYRRLVASADVVELDGIGHYPQIEDPPSVLAGLRTHVESTNRT